MILPDLKTQTSPSQNNWLLSVYAQQIGYDENLFWGLKPTTENSCVEVLTKPQRDSILFALLTSKQKIESFLLSPIYPTWILDERQTLRTYLFRTNWMNIVKLGTEKRDLISSFHLNFSSEEGYFSIDTTIEFNSLEFCFPSTSQRIFPSKIETTSTGYIVYFPKARLISPAYVNNPKEGWEYFPEYINSVFAENLDCYQITAISPYVEGLFYNCDTCSDTREELFCSEVDTKTGFIRVGQNQKFTSHVSVNYLSYQEPDQTILDALVSLTNSLMPNEFTTCDQIRYRWEKDRTPSPQICPFGELAGALHAWNILQNKKVIRSFLQ